MYAHCASSWEGSVPPKPYPNCPCRQVAGRGSRAVGFRLAYQAIVEGRPAHADPHGTADKTTPLNQSTRFHEAAKKIGVQSELIIIEGAPHSFHLQPKQRDLRSKVIGFFDTHLKPNE